MPPKKRASGPTATSRSQGTISFNKNQSTNRITKPSAQSLDEKKSSKKPNVVDVEIKDDALPPTSSEIAIADQAQQAESTDPLTTSLTTENILGGRAQEDVTGAIGGVSNSGWVNDEETRARKIGEKAIASYWAAKERARKAPRVHQQDLSTGEKVLREWDMSGQYGPCVGMSELLHLLHWILFRCFYLCLHHLLCYCYGVGSTDCVRHCEIEALEESEYARSEPANRGTGCAAQ